MKVTVSNPQITRQILADPFLGMTHKERLRKAGVIDLTDNHTIEILGNGYAQIKPIGINKLVK